MKLELYNEIVKAIPVNTSRGYLSQVAARFPGVPKKTIGSILSQEYQRKTRKSHHYHSNQDALEHDYSVYLTGVEAKQEHILLTLADTTDQNASMLARRILDKYLSEQNGGKSVHKSIVSSMIKDPNLIDDPVLAREVFQCIVCDDYYGPYVESIKRSVGHEYEFKLTKTLDELGLSYIEEDQMRERGYDKTPDVKLEIPIAVDGHIVNWVESKASFGDEMSHRGYLKDQFWAYWNRFGPGMVIYWFGFIDELDVNQDKGIILRDSFPENIVKMNPLLKQEVTGQGKS
ncbi:CDAN1-interacting nuclease 1-like [Haliotis cracherodii]|uniref:CDAN1-interacting nuclease 1-like n=1 Tax=Haliotis cracherodii TaxID=6455 RepID=UPI0039EB2A9C